MPAKIGERVLDRLVATRLDERDVQLLEDFSKQRRLKKGFIIREALRHYIAQEELTTDQTAVGSFSFSKRESW